MIFFNYDKIYLLASGRSGKIVSLFKRLCKDPEQYKVLSGYSFVLNPTTFTENSNKLSNRQLAEYLGILSIRNYRDYLSTGNSSLDIELLYPWIPKEVVQTNPLIAINKSQIQFIEEYKYG